MSLPRRSVDRHDRGAPGPPSAVASQVVFCDLVGSTALSARLDPEDMREVVRAYHRCCAAVIAEAGGLVAQYLGDGVLRLLRVPSGSRG